MNYVSTFDVAYQMIKLKLSHTVHLISADCSQSTKKILFQQKNFLNKADIRVEFYFDSEMFF